LIRTLTANPSVDRTLTVAEPLVAGRVLRAASVREDAGGKGLNVARAVHQAGLAVEAVFPAHPGDPLLPLLDPGLPTVVVPIANRTRTNLTLVTDPGVTTKINEPGPPLADAEVAALTAAIVGRTQPGDAVMLSGSLAPGLPDDYYVTLTRELRARGAWVGVDTADAPLAALVAALAEGAAPDFLAPNALELGQATGLGDLDTAAARGDLDAVRAAAETLTDMGVGEVLVTLGSRGALLVTGEGTWVAPAAPARVLSTVGAGDSAVAGYLIARARGGNPGERLAWAVAYGTAAVALPGTAIPGPADVDVDRRTVRRERSVESFR
jgi:1-phosphofructokinase family hexose kinase